MERAWRFLSHGDLTLLFELPLDPATLLRAGVMLVHTPARPPSPLPTEPVPTLTASMRARLHTLVEAEGRYADAALFLLSRDLQAQAFNRLIEASHAESRCPC